VYRIIKSVMVSDMKMINFGSPKFNHSTQMGIEPSQVYDKSSRYGLRIESFDRKLVNYKEPVPVNTGKH